MDHIQVCLEQMLFYWVLQKQKKTNFQLLFLLLVNMFTWIWKTKVVISSVTSNGSVDCLGNRKPHFQSCRLEGKVARQWKNLKVEEVQSQSLLCRKIVCCLFLRKKVYEENIFIDFQFFVCKRLMIWLLKWQCCAQFSFKCCTGLSVCLISIWRFAHRDTKVPG